MNVALFCRINFPGPERTRFIKTLWFWIALELLMIFLLSQFVNNFIPQKGLNQFLSGEGLERNKFELNNKEQTLYSII